MTSHHWNPTVHNDGTQTAYFRGRRLRGKAVILPKGYCGYVVEKTDAMVEQRRAGEGGGEPQEQEDAVETKAMELKAAFEEVVVWGHEAVPSEQAGDEYVRGVEEWIAFAHAVSLSTTHLRLHSGRC